MSGRRGAARSGSSGAVRSGARWERNGEVPEHRAGGGGDDDTAEGAWGRSEGSGGRGSPVLQEETGRLVCPAAGGAPFSSGQRWPCWRGWTPAGAALEVVVYGGAGLPLTRQRCGTRRGEGVPRSSAGSALGSRGGQRWPSRLCPVAPGRALASGQGARVLRLGRPP